MCRVALKREKSVQGKENQNKIRITNAKREKTFPSGFAKRVRPSRPPNGDYVCV